MKAVFSIVATLFFSVTLSAQTATTTTQTADVSTIDSDIDWGNFELELDTEIAAAPWTFHTNQNSKLLYIDFEALGGKMSHLVIRSNEKSVVIEDNHLFDLPANTIYEVNLDNLKRGSYFVELYTFNNEVINKEITIQ